QCKNNLKQMGLALHNYHDASGVFPPANIRAYNSTTLLEYGNGFAWGALILPHMDQAGLYGLLDFNIGCFEGTNKTVILSLNGMPGVICPSDANRSRTIGINVGQPNGMTSVPNTSYFGTCGPFIYTGESTNTNYASGFFRTQNGPAVSISSIRDGTSNTIAVGERSARWRTDGSWLGIQSATQSPIGGASDPVNNVHWYLTYGLYRPGTSLPAGDTVRVSSDHQGGVQVLMADGSVKFLSENINHTLSGDAADAANVPFGIGCNWRNGVAGCADGSPPTATPAGTGGMWNDKQGMRNLMGVYQRLHSGNDGLDVGEF
ncbi:MAG: hypothetical protein B7Z55_18960, partial [Planctomycetales bacterium 12-60-4]